MRVLDCIEQLQVAGCGETKEPPKEESSDDKQTAEEMIGEWVTMGCIAATKGAAGGIPCDMAGKIVTAVLENSPDINAGNAWSCAKIGKNCDQLEGAGK